MDYCFEFKLLSILSLPPKISENKWRVTRYGKTYMDSLTDGINLRFLMAISIFCAETTSFLVAIRSDPRKSSNQGNQGKSNRFEKPDFPINRGMEMLKMGLIAEPSP